MLGMQRALSVIYPPQCQICANFVAEDGGLCSECWAKTPFLRGLVCDLCGTSLPGADSDLALCDDCMTVPRPWDAGRAALSYRDAGRRIVLALKHGDRLDLAAPAAGWMRAAAGDYVCPDTLFVPIPVHWTRLLTRRYNQAAELTRALADQTGQAHCPDALIRVRRTAKQDGMSVEERMRNMEAAIEANPKRAGTLHGARVCLVDDVMTSGATLAAGARALKAVGADHVFVLLLARVEKSP